jgi:hypothetical protein
MGPQDPKDVTRDTARDLSALVGELAGETMPLCRSIGVLKQLITDEPNLRTVEPELLYHLVSLVFDAPHAQLVGLTVDAFQPLVHLEDNA